MKAPSKRPGQIGDFIGVRAQPDFVKKLDAWRRTQDDLPGRPEAIRRLVEQALDSPPKKKA